MRAHTQLLGRADSSRRLHGNGTRSPKEVTALVNQVLRSPGRALDEQSQSFFGSRFAHSFEHVSVSPVPRGESDSGVALHEADDSWEQQASRMASAVMRPDASLLSNRRTAVDFSDVRVHTGTNGEAVTRAVGARAVTLGQHVIFSRGAYQPTTGDGRRLLAHELTHTIQQGTQPTQGTCRVLQRSAYGFFSNIFQSIFGYAFADKTLNEYLDKLNRTNTIEDDWDSDNKAEQIANSWGKGEGKFILTARLKALLIREMLSGWVGPGDQKATLNLLTRSDNPELEYIFGAGKVKHAKLLSEFGSQKDDLYRFYQRRYIEAYSKKIQDEMIFGSGSVPPSKPDLSKLESGKVKPGGQIVQPGDPLPKTGSPYFDPVKSKKTKRRTTPLSRDEADAWINEVYGKYFPADKKPKKGKGYLSREGIETHVYTPQHSGQPFEEYIYYCIRVERSKCSSSDSACRSRAKDFCVAGESSVRGFYDRENNEIGIRKDRESPSTRLHEAVHAYADAATDRLERYGMEGLTEYLTRQIILKHKPKKGQARLAVSQSYGGPYQVILELSLIVGEPLLARVHFQGAVKELCEKLGKEKFDAWRNEMRFEDSWQKAIAVLHRPSKSSKARCT